MVDADAVSDFIRANTGSLYRTAFLLTGNGHAAEELLQDTLARLYPKWDKVTSADSSVAYVRRALTNRFVSSRRPAAARDVSVWELPDGWDGADLSESVATSARVWHLLAALPDRQRAAVVLRYFYDLADDDIAETIECRPPTVRTLIRRGLSALRTAHANAAAAEASPRSAR